MILKYKNIYKNKAGKTPAFSLVEVMISLLILSILMVAMAPVVTKKNMGKKVENIVYKYTDEITSKKCYSGSSSTASTSGCSEYTFTVPNGVERVNLTLVAGGGGGGGAGGEYDIVTNVTPSSALTLAEAAWETINEIKVKYLTAQGATGGNYNTSCNGGTYCGGRGGNSSNAIIDFVIPFRLNLGNGFVSKLKAGSGSNLKVEIGTMDSKYGIGVNGNVKYYVNGTGFYCKIGSVEKSSFTDCGIPKESAVSPVAGAYGQATSAGVTSILSGGNGGHIPSIPANYGSGARGKAVKLTCSTSCTSSTSSIPDGSAGAAYGLATVKRKYSGAAGGGGAAGTALVIKGFPVTAGETYIVRVGKGGAGGAAGTQNQTGTAGEAGYSTAIYKYASSTETLVYRVNGGTGGAGGAKGTSSNYSQTTAASNSYNAVVTTDNDSYFDLPTDSKTVLNDSKEKERYVTYPVLRTMQPYQTLTYGRNTTPASNNYKISGFSGYLNSSAAATDIYTGSNINVNGSNLSNIYTGLYYRTIVNNRPAYVGGLGGFSGLGGKAGCGGLFLGNYNGAYNSGSNTNAFLQNKILIGTALYDITDYYDNCTIYSSNGQTADFVEPSITSNGVSYGQAGSGGGGGGFSYDLGAGKGGNGQNGYLMIDWSK